MEPATLRSSRFDEPALQASALAGWDLHYVQLTPGRFEGASRELRLPGIQLARERNNVTVNQFGRTLRGSVVFGSPVQVAGPIVVNGRALPPASIGILGSGRELDAVQPPMDLMVLAIDEDLLRAYVRDTEACEAWTLPAGHAACVDDAERARGFSTRLFQALEAAFAAPDLLQGPALGALQEDLLALAAPLIAGYGRPQAESRCLFAHAQVVRRARDFLQQRIADTVQVSDLCRHLRVSRRALQYAFIDVTGTTPAAYLRLLRLNGARRDLLRSRDGAVQVKEVLARWGFWHFSRFSADYRRMYGELPSATLASARN